MAESNANIGVVVGGDIGPLRESLSKGKSLVADFTSQTRKAANDIVKMGAAASVAAAGGLAATFKITAANAREIKNFASVANASVEQMQRMAYGASQVDVSMEKLADILKDTNERIGDFSRAGSGPMVDFFENIAPKLGLTIDHFKKLSGPDALQAYYNALEKANLNQQEMTVYLEDLASDTTRLIPLLKNGGAGFAEMSREANELGIVMSGIDIAQIEAANKTLDRAKGAAKAAGNAISVELAPYVEAVVDQFIELSKEAGGFGPIVQTSVERAVKVIGFMANSIHGVKVLFKGLHVAAAAVGTGITAVFNGVAQKVNDLVASMARGINTLTEQMSRIPGVDIDAIGMPKFGESVQSVTDLAVDNLKRLRQELHDLAMQPLPSEGVEQFLNDIKTRSVEAAKEVAETVQSAMSQDLESGGGSGADPRIDALKQRYLTEEELLRQHRETMALIGQEYDAKNFETEEQWNSVRLQALDDHNRRMKALREAEKVSALSITSSLGSSMISLAQGQSKKAFEIGKKVAIASATVKGVQSAVDAWQAGMSTGGPWAPAVAASYTAASLAKTGGLIRSIQSQQYSGGGGQPSASGGGVPSVSPQGGAGQQASAGTQSTFILDIDPGEVVTGRGVIDMINRAIKNGAQIQLSES